MLLEIWAIFKIVISYSKNKGSCGRVSANRLRDLQTYISFLSRFKLFHLCFKKNDFLSLPLSVPSFHVPLFVYTPSISLEFSQSSLNKWAAAAVLSIYPYAGTLSYGDLKCNIKTDFSAYSYNIISETISYLFVFNCIFYSAFSEVLSQLFCVSFWREITMSIITQII